MQINSLNLYRRNDVQEIYVFVVVEVFRFSLLDQDAISFSTAMFRLVQEDDLLQKMRIASKKHIEDNFTNKAMVLELQKYLEMAMQS